MLADPGEEDSDTNAPHTYNVIIDTSNKERLEATVKLLRSALSYSKRK